ncbi:MAG: phosphonate metabolism protein/1,5-bisphosphokinase (PRPP-forming) PhnN [Roseobacter sp.]
MTGRIIAIVGPSGVGKDSVMSGLSAIEPRLTCARRVITRPEDVGGEIFHGVTPKTFEKMQKEGAFALCWSAHGLLYGIPTSVNVQLNAGQDVLLNLSRSVLQTAAERFSKFEVIALTATADALQQRLTDRGREDATDIARRLARAPVSLPTGITSATIDNSGPLDQTVAGCISQLYPLSEKR